MLEDQGPLSRRMPARNPRSRPCAPTASMPIHAIPSSKQALCRRERPLPIRNLLRRSPPARGNTQLQQGPSKQGPPRCRCRRRSFSRCCCCCCCCRAPGLNPAPRLVARTRVPRAWERCGRETLPAWSFRPVSSDRQWRSAERAPQRSAVTSARAGQANGMLRTISSADKHQGSGLHTWMAPALPCHDLLRPSSAGRRPDVNTNCCCGRNASRLPFGRRACSTIG